VFSVIVLQIRGGDKRSKGEHQNGPLDDRAMRAIAEVIDSLTHPTDMVSLLSANELAVYGADGTDPTNLVQAARTSANLGVRSRPKAA
jgi:hypothetical protein